MIEGFIIFLSLLSCSTFKQEKGEENKKDRIQTQELIEEEREKFKRLREEIGKQEEEEEKEES